MINEWLLTFLLWSAWFPVFVHVCRFNWMKMFFCSGASSLNEWYNVLVWSKSQTHDEYTVCIVLQRRIRAIRWRFSYQTNEIIIIIYKRTNHVPKWTRRFGDTPIDLTISWFCISWFYMKHETKYHCSAIIDLIIYYFKNKNWIELNWMLILLIWWQFICNVYEFEFRFRHSLRPGRAKFSISIVS